MGLPLLEVLLDGDPVSGWRVRSPAVGVWSRIPASGAMLDETGLGVLVQAGRRFLLRLPADTVGFVCEVPAGARKAINVEWGQELFRLAPVTGEATRGALTGRGTPAAEASADILVAPTDGVFYARPSPGTDAFVSPGDTVTQGQAVGLIEVMKTFNHVLFAGDGLPAAAVVKEFLASDGEEVRAGDPLLRYDPVG